ncbi:MAG: 5-methyltetrahydropteroyltriglutamate--homocysteine S-methyltransferase [Dehalococcoidia bacterium]|nr:5-methyltetrahydropteroyltriglutamate--homocysteine S-methyltransferase [Dehalococcoidia bacterium]
MLTSNLGYPRIGLKRDLKKVTEDHWAGKATMQELLAVGDTLRRANFEAQRSRGIELMPCGDFSYYDLALDTALMVGAVPKRFGWRPGDPVDLDLEFALARGAKGAQACEMTKWFDTNYHYLVPEIEGPFTLTQNRSLAEFQFFQRALGVKTKPVVLGPFTFIALARNASGRPAHELLRALTPVYAQMLGELDRAGVEWVQMDEPALVLEQPAAALAALLECYRDLAQAKGRVKLMLQTYFGGLADAWDTVMALPVEGVGLDFVRTEENLTDLRGRGFPRDKALGAGIVNGRNVWATDLPAALQRLEAIARHVPQERLWVQPSCSLLHLPINRSLEKELDPELKSVLAYADDRLDEVRTLAQGLGQGRAAIAEELAENQRVLRAWRSSPRHTDPLVQARLRDLKENDLKRQSSWAVRHERQAEALPLPPLPTTTIGSFPQTADVRRERDRWKRGASAEAEYKEFVRGKIRELITFQERVGLDVLVHGEFERADMVDYFAEQLQGMAFIQGWVQSYGSRYVRPPLIYGDVSRPRPMTVEWFSYTQGLTQKPVKGMLTGPLTMLKWSFARDDIPLEQVAYQLALSIRDEVSDLEAAGARIIQVDEPAFREGLPLKRRHWPDYLRWAVRAFGLASAGVRDETQIHTHMCYAEFNDIIEAIDAMDADAISIEDSRSAGKLLGAFERFKFERAVGPGVYDIHSPQVADKERMKAQLRAAARVIRPKLLWVNPDCGLKTRDWKETAPSLENMVATAQELRQEMNLVGS